MTCTQKRKEMRERKIMVMKMMLENKNLMILVQMKTHLAPEQLSLFNRRLTKSFASEDKEGQGASSKLGSAFKTARKIPDSVLAQNGRLPHNRI